MKKLEKTTGELFSTKYNIRAAERSAQEGNSSESENSVDENQFRPGKKAKSEINVVFPVFCVHLSGKTMT